MRTGKMIVMCVALLCPLALAHDSGHPPQDDQVFQSIIKSSSALKTKLRRQPDFTRKLNEIVESTTFLQEVFATSHESQLPPSYSQSLNLDAKILASLVKQVRRKYDKKKALEDLQNVAADLSLKVDHIKHSRGGALKTIQVVVHTKKANQAATGYEVWYVPKGWARERTAFKRFDKLSGPTSIDLAPGNYFMWAQFGQTTTGRTPVSLGGDGKSRREIDLIVP